MNACLRTRLPCIRASQLVSLALCCAWFHDQTTVLAADPLDTWHIRTPPLSAKSIDFQGAAYGNGRWVVVGAQGTILSSADGVEWFAEVNPAGKSKLDDVAFGAGIFLAIGAGNGVVLTSTDGRQWTQQPDKPGGAAELIHDGTQFVALSAGGFLATSPDGTHWANQNSVPTLYVDVGGIAYGNGTYVEVGYKRTGKPTDLWSSVGLSNWQFRDAKSHENLFGAGFGLGQFVAVGQGGTLITSPDGMEWTLRSVPHTGFIWDVCEGASYLAAAGQWGRVLTSPNGADWTLRETGSPDHLTDIAFGDGTFLAVGWDGQIVQSEALTPTQTGANIVLSQTTTADTEVHFRFTGILNQAYQVQATSDWRSWTPVATVTCTSSPMSVTLPEQNGKSRFYRVMKQ